MNPVASASVSLGPMWFAARPIPLASFGSVIGTAGLGLAWRMTANAHRAPAFVGEALLVASGVLFVALVITWLLRIRSHPREIRTESSVAVTQSYFGAIVISIALLAAAALPYSRNVAFVLWIAAAIGGAALLLYLLGRWIERGIPSYELTPALFIPVVGNATCVYVAVPLGYTDLGWASFSFAALCWLSLGPLVLYRLLAVEPRLPRKMAPQLAVLVSSPAVLASSWVTLTGNADPVFKVLVFKAVFFALLTVRLWKIAWGEAYNVAMWGWTFPAAALAGALERAATLLDSRLYADCAAIALTLATFTVAACTFETVRGWIQSFAMQCQSASNEAQV